MSLIDISLHLREKFIIADTSGYIQYTRNMVTGVPTTNLAIILIDARHGVIEQTKRYALIASLLHILHVIVCVNKMDFVDFSEEIFHRITNDFLQLAFKILIKDIRFSPKSDLLGYNVVNLSKNMSWFIDAPLLHTLKTINISSDMIKWTFDSMFKPC